MTANIDSKNMPYAQQPTLKPQAHLGASLTWANRRCWQLLANTANANRVAILNMQIDRTCGEHNRSCFAHAARG